MDFKKQLWANVEEHAPTEAIFWTSTSGIPASMQNVLLKDKSRLLVVHPFNPPHILPLLEVVPSPDTSSSAVEKTIDFWKRQMGREPIVLKKEIPRFFAGRLAWILLQEAVYLINEGIVDVEQVDLALQNSMAIRWAYAGPFKSFHAGGGPGGLAALFKNVGDTIQACWNDAGRVQFGDGSGWERKLCERVAAVNGETNIYERDNANRSILEVVRGIREGRLSQTNTQGY